jgi:hypothetical protein
LLELLRFRQRSGRAPEIEIGAYADKKGAEWGAREEARRVEQDAREVLDQFQRSLDEVALLEADCLPERGRPRPSADLVRRWRRLIAALDDLSRLVAAALPYPERDTCVHLLKRRIDRLEARLADLGRVIEQEQEEVARSVLAQRSSRIELGRDLVHPDAELIEEWMLQRYMIRELAGSGRLRILALLTAPAFVAAWIVAPFLACIVLHRGGLFAWRGIPFAVATVLNLALLGGYFLETRRSRPFQASAGRLLLPQTTAALLLGMLEVVGADEAWSLAVLEYPWVRWLTIGAFLIAGFLFVREVLLAGQLEAEAERKAKSRRAASVVALVLWQSFALVVLFGVLSGRVMGDRAGLDPTALASAGGWLPYEVHLGSGFLAPAPSDSAAVSDAAYRVFPWALLSWTAQIFFFSAVFEQIMRRRS